MNHRACTGCRASRKSVIGRLERARNTTGSRAATTTAAAIHTESPWWRYGDHANPSDRLPGGRELLSRRKFFTTAALAAAAVGTGGAAAYATPAVLPGQREYRTLTMRGYNRRYVARPRQIHLPATAQEVRQAVANSVRDGLRIAARSGGHCFEDFVDSAETKSLIDLRRLDRVDWDDEHRAFSVGTGLTLETLYTELARWGVTVPGGICRAVGVGGHISGGGYGPLSRKHGVVADHLYGVEVATVARDGGP
jgi:FAD/FMN-containing dehydrogenase